MKEFGERLKSKCQLFLFHEYEEKMKELIKSFHRFVEYHDWYAAYTHIDVPGH